MPQGQLSDRLRGPDSHGVHPLPIHAIDQSEQLSMVELHPMLTDPRPDKVRLLQSLAVQDHARAIPPDDFDTIRPLGPKDVKRSVEGSDPASRTSARPSGPFLKSTGWLARNTFTPAGIMLDAPLGGL